MATYTYICENTECVNNKEERLIEASQSMHDAPLTYCSDCKQETLQRVIGNQGGFRIGGGHNSTSMWNVSGDPGPRRKGYDCDPMN